MTRQEFIEAIAQAAAKYAGKFNIKVISPIIAQACLESGYGTSEKAKYHNYFGLKYRKNRVSCNNGYFKDGGSEQNKDGTYTPINTDWYSFETLEMGVLGYFQFTAIKNYDGIRNITDPHKYLENIKAAGYATSQKYVENVYRVITTNNLTIYDNLLKKEKKEEKTMGYTNSPLVSYTNIAKYYKPRTHAIDTITIHCFVGQVTAKRGCDYFASISRKASCNYVVGKDGDIGLSVEEKNMSYCSSNAANDNRAITIECASDTSHPYAVTDAALKALIKLCADICKRNGIKKLLWKGDKSLIGQVDKQNMTVHRWFKKKACPGEYLYSRHGYIADEVNKLLGATTQATTTPAQTTTTKQLYRVRKSWADAESQTGAYSILENAKKNCKEGYSVYDWNGKEVYSNKPQRKYTVMKGDSYWKIAQKFYGNGARWKEIAKANNNKNTLHPGDVLIIP